MNLSHHFQVEILEIPIKIPPEIDIRRKVTELRGIDPLLRQQKVPRDLVNNHNRTFFVLVGESKQLEMGNLHRQPTRQESKIICREPQLGGLICRDIWRISSIGVVNHQLIDLQKTDFQF